MNPSASQGRGRVRFSRTRRSTTDQTARVKCWSINQARAPMLGVMTKTSAVRYE